MEKKNISINSGFRKVRIVLSAALTVAIISGFGSCTKDDEEKDPEEDEAEVSEAAKDIAQILRSYF